MKRTWSSILVVASVLGLLTLFLGLQYRWLSKVSEAEHERAQKRVEADTARFAEDFNREMQAAYFNFQTDAKTWINSDWSEFNERYDFWKSRTVYPELIRDIYFVANDPDAGPIRYDAEKRTFTPAEETAELQRLRPRLADDQFQPVYEDAFAMALAVYEHEKHLERIVIRETDHDLPAKFKIPEKFGWLIVQLDESVVKERLLPDLASKYFASEYKLAVRDRTGNAVYSTADIAGADATAGMFNMSPDNLLFFAGREAIQRSGGERNGQVIVNKRTESHMFRRTGKDGSIKDGDMGTFKIELQQPGATSSPRTTVMTSTGEAGTSPWMLNVQHQSGSIASFIAWQRNKSFLIGLAVYLLLVAGILAIVLSAMRSKRFAQRQIDFVSSVSHEFRTPLAVIYSAGENLADGVTKETAQISRYGELIKGEGKKLSAMVEQILEFAGADSGRRKYNLAPTNAADVVEDAIDECRPLIESNDFLVETDVHPGLPDVLADRAALSTALQNLIANSVKYSDGSRWLKISATNGGGAVKISVEDRGIGIRGDEQGLIFEPFYRAKEVVDAQISGNGLGLNLVKKIAAAHKGRVTVESKPGSGSKFTIEIPQNQS